jgi:fimbrial chaperone protein
MLSVIKNHFFIKPLFSFAILTTLSFLPPFTPTANAESVLQILPTRIVLEKERSMSVTLVNRGDEEGSYRLFLRNIRLDENGKFLEVAEADALLEGEFFADKMIQFSPRRVTVPANSKQQVKVVLRKPKDLAAGEYRSHLVFRKLPKQESVLDDNDKKMDFALKPIVEVTIPVIVRHGELQAAASIDDIKLGRDEDNGQEISMVIHRTGTRSLYGDLNIWWTPPNAEKQRIAFAKGLAVYTPNKNRKFAVSVLPEFVVTEKGTLSVEFIEDPAYGGDQTAKANKAW